MFKKLDYPLFISVIIIALLSSVSVISATYSYADFLKYAFKHIIAICFGFIFMLIVASLHFQVFRIYCFPIYIITFILLILPLLIGDEVRGTKAWIKIGEFSIQPSEFSKLALIITISALMDKYNFQFSKFKHLVCTIVVFTIPTVLILLQKDTSSAVVYFVLMFSFLFISRIKKWYLACIVVGSLLSIFFTLFFIYISHIGETRINIFTILYPYVFNNIRVVILLLLGSIFLFVFIWWILRQLLFRVSLMKIIFIWFVIIGSLVLSHFFASSLKIYQKRRILAFISPKSERLSYGYSIQQAQIAIGSGRLFGRGILSGTQTQLGFIPEKHTDFIFSVISEELGFLASAILLFLYFLLLFRCNKAISLIDDRFGISLCFGIIVMFSFNIIYNIGMNIGLFPVIGIPLPFFSYGGSAMVSSFIAIGLVQSIFIRSRLT